MSDLAVLLNASFTKLAVLVARLAIETEHSEIAVEVERELLRMAERAGLEMAVLRTDPPAEEE